MITRREAVKVLGSAAAGFWITATSFGFNSSAAKAFAASGKDDSTPPLAPGSPMSAERIGRIETFKKQSEGLDKKYEARTHKGAWTMPYRLFRPQGSGKMPLVVYLHGSGGQGDDNLKQLGLGNIFGTRVWLLPENQKKFPCYVLAPQSDRGWVRYDPAKLEKGGFEMVPGLGQGTGMVVEVMEVLRREFAIDERRIYVMGQSMGGAGTWNIVSNHPELFAAAAICCGSISTEDGTGAIDVPVWSFHGNADQTVPVTVSRERVAARRKVGGRPLYTEYDGVDHNVWEWAFTEPELVKWIFSQRRG